MKKVIILIAFLLVGCDVNHVPSVQTMIATSSNPARVITQTPSDVDMEYYRGVYDDCLNLLVSQNVPVTQTASQAGAILDCTMVTSHRLHDDWEHQDSVGFDWALIINYPTITPSPTKKN